MYRIAVRARARKQLKKIALADVSSYRMLVKAIETLAEWPDTQSGRRLRNHQFDYRLRVGRYRILFDVDQADRLILVQKVTKRDDRTY